MKILCWNVNSLKVRLDQVVEIITKFSPDIISLQETKSQDENFPEIIFKDLGYESIFIGQKTFNGVAVVTKLPFKNLIFNIPNLIDDQKRFICLDVAFEDKNFTIMNGYFPNGQALDSDKFQYKSRWIEALKVFLQKNNTDSFLMGDFNIAPKDIDCHDPQKWTDTVLTSDVERNHFEDIINSGFIDSYRYLYPDDPGFTWWDYRMAAFRRNLGLRIDHILCSKNLISSIKNFEVLKDFRKLERPSDHAPILLTMKF